MPQEPSARGGDWRADRPRTLVDAYGSAAGHAQPRYRCRRKASLRASSSRIERRPQPARVCAGLRVLNDLQAAGPVACRIELDRAFRHLARRFAQHRRNGRLRVANVHDEQMHRPRKRNEQPTPRHHFRIDHRLRGADVWMLDAIRIEVVDGDEQRRPAFEAAARIVLHDAPRIAARWNARAR